MNQQKTGSFKLVGWMAGNPVAANLLMMAMIISGIYYFLHIRQEVQPNYTFSTVLIDVEYPGASPVEIEQGIVLAIEARISELEGINRVTSTSKDGAA